MHEYKGKIKPEFIARATGAYSRYKGDMEPFRKKVRDNDKWYKCNYGQAIRPGTNEPGPATAFISSAIFARYADFIDNYPAPNILERRPDGEETAKKLRDIVPVILEMAKFKKTYKRNCYNKMKNGAGIYGVFANEAAKRIDITAVDVMDFFCDVHARDLQDSDFVFVRSALSNDWLREQYPKFRDLFQGDCSTEGREGNYTLDNRTEVIDCYYKTVDKGVQLMKLVSGVVIDATEDCEGYEAGLYAHGLYPFVIDTMYPDDDNLMGFGLVDIIRNPQMYIDKLDAAILKNAMLASHPRWIIKDTGGINKKEFTDMSNEVIMSAMDVDEKNIRAFQPESLPVFVREHRENKINELKEIAGNRDWNNGGTGQGVTAASAIEALQSAGQKLSRANIDDTYDAYKELVAMVIELIRQFYDTEEMYRVTDENGVKSFITFSNAEMYERLSDSLGFMGGEWRAAEYDIDVIPQRQNPFTRETNNQTINALWAGGYFLDQNYEQAIIALNCMHFDSRDKLVSLMQERHEQMMQMQNPLTASGGSLPLSGGVYGGASGGNVPVSGGASGGNVPTQQMTAAAGGALGENVEFM